MKVLVTGIEGFVGRHLAVSLKNAGHKPCGTVLRALDLENTRKALGNVPMELADLRFSSSIARLLTRWKPDCIIHLAAQSSGSLAFREPLNTYRTNVLGTVNTLESIRKTNWHGRVLIVSSGEVYGNVIHNRPLTEEDPVAPVNHYATSKAMAEMVAEEYCRSYGVRAIVSRAFPHTGPGQSDRFALSSFAKQLARAKKKDGGILRVGNLDAVRDYLDVRDVASAYLRIVESGKDGEVYNIARGRGYRIGDLLEQLIDLSGARVEIIQEKSRMRKVDIGQLVGDPGRLVLETGWKPTIEIRTTLRDMLTSWEHGTIFF